MLGSLLQFKVSFPDGEKLEIKVNPSTYLRERKVSLEETISKKDSLPLITEIAKGRG